MKIRWCQNTTISSIAEETNGELLTLKEASKKQDSFFEGYDGIVYGGWVMAGMVNKSAWFKNQMSKWSQKRLAIFAVGASLADDEKIKNMMEGLVPANQNCKSFYFQGGINYDAMNFSSKMLVKALTFSLKKKDNPTEQEKWMLITLGSSHDDSNKEYIKPLVDYFIGE